MSNVSKQLCSGDELTMTEFANRRDDASLVVLAGGCIYLTRRGKRRMALVPAEVAEAYYTNEKNEDASGDATDEKGTEE